MNPDLLKVLGLALVGEAVPVPEAGADVAEWLSGNGWTPARIADLRHQRQEAGEAWPFPVAPELVRPIGFARFTAVLAQARTELGVDGLVPTRHTGPRVIGPAERRLLAERPPHHGNVG